MKLLETDPFRPPDNSPPVPDVVALDDEQTTHLVTRAFEMLACALAAQYSMVDRDVALRAGLDDEACIDIVSRAVLFAVDLVKEADAADQRLVDVWERDWHRALSPFTQGYSYQATSND